MPEKNLSGTLLIRASADLLTRVKSAANAARQPISWWVRDALEERLARIEAEVKAQRRHKAPAKRPRR